MCEKFGTYWRQRSVLFVKTEGKGPLGRHSHRL